MKPTIPLLFALALFGSSCDDSDCGNGLLDPGEQCDFGNQFNGTGCDQFCRIGPNFRLSQNCGNGVIELLVGEQCDDGNRLNGDGCNQFCLAEYPWGAPGWGWGYGPRPGWRRW